MGLGGRAKKVTRLVETGRLGSATRVLMSESNVAEIDDEVLGALRSLHPAGVSHPFGDSVGPFPGTGTR